MNVHFVGIGGIGVSALARYYSARGHKVTGSDLAVSEITESLEKEEVFVYKGHKGENLKKDTDLVIKSVAVPEKNPELQKAKKLGIRVLTYPEALGEITKKHWTIAVSGAHGKGTTTALISLAMIEAELDPTVVIGTNLPQFGGKNFRPGSSKYLVVEADEYKKAFLNYHPKAVATTNIDEEHLDCYRNLAEIKEGFLRFWGKVPEKGFLVLNKDDKNIISLKEKVEELEAEVGWYTLKQKRAKEVREALTIPGEHNVSNGLAAFMVCRRLGIKKEFIFKGLASYKGGWRRFEVLQEKPFTLISDYAHHPTEIEATLRGARERYPGKTIWAVFQPHQFQRTHYLFEKFAPSLKIADKVVLTKIYSVAGREKGEIKKKVSGQKLFSAVEKEVEAFFVKDFRKIPSFLQKKVGEGDAVVVMGAGDIYKITGDLIK